MKQKSTTDLLRRLRAVMKNLNHVPEKLHAYIVPSEDAHQSEYLAQCDARRAFISGFTGSRGMAVVTESAAALWTDGRYFLQAEQQLDANWTLMKEGLSETPTVAEWLGKTLPDNGRVGVDPYVISTLEFKRLKAELEGSGILLLSIGENLIDHVWGSERPVPPRSPVDLLPLNFTGKSWKDKVQMVREKMEQHGAKLIVLSALDEIAWLFNLRGSDIPFNPVFFAYAAVGLDSVCLFMDHTRLSILATQELHGVVFHPYSSVVQQLSVAIENLSGAKVWIPSTCSQALASLVSKAQRLEKASPIQLMKAMKNSTELTGMREAHLKDAVAHCEFLYWLEQEMHAGHHLTETEVANMFEEFRRDQANYVGLSFETISASGPNAAVCHYRVSEESNRALTKSEIYLVDSGAQFKDGTTDVTRTVFFGEPSEHQRECFTRVLQGHIALATLKFPEGTSGYRLDCISRMALWEVGLDYMHGTGHGVGHYLCVHEGPSGFASRRINEEGIMENMALTIEPGYYEDGNFGIRIENVYETVVARTEFSFKGRKFLTFEPLTLVPIQQKLLKPSLLSAKEVDWLNNYHALVQERVGAVLEEQGKPQVLQWLSGQTRPLG